MKSIVIVVIALIIGILATILTTDLIGVTQIFSGNKSTEDRKPGAGEILLPISKFNIPAFDRVGIQDVAMVIVKESMITGPAPITDATQINGRILKTDKLAGRFFAEEDFMPIGTKSGIAGATPPGKRGITVRADKIVGAYSLQAGDTFDLLLTVNSRTAANTSSILGSTLGYGAPGSTILVVNGGVVLRSVTPRLESREVRKGMIGSETEIQQTPVNELSIAISPNEVATLTAAISSNQELVAVVRSGQVGAGANELEIVIPKALTTSNVPNTAPAVEVANEAPVTVKSIEVIVGNKRSEFQYTDNQ
ncbi:MAG: hypothetical protein ACFCU1_04065 [Sumerlaeia bacterium]